MKPRYRELTAAMKATPLRSLRDIVAEYGFQAFAKYLGTDEDWDIGRWSRHIPVYQVYRTGQTKVHKAERRGGHNKMAIDWDKVRHIQGVGTRTYAEQLLSSYRLECRGRWEDLNAQVGGTMSDDTKRTLLSEEVARTRDTLGAAAGPCTKS